MYAAGPFESHYLRNGARSFAAAFYFRRYGCLHKSGMPRKEGKAVNGQNRSMDAPLEQIRRRSGSEKFRSVYRKIAEEGGKKAVLLLNDERLRFPTLYLLLPEIAALHPGTALSPRNRTAVSLCAAAESGGGFEAEEKNDTGAALKWMFETGYRDDGLSAGYDQALDAAAALLTRVYHDADVLPDMVRLLFLRNRKKRYLHDLAWALFGSGDPRVLRLTAEYLRSPNRRDVELAGKLLRNAPPDRADGGPEQNRYGACVSWLRENGPYLEFTGESFHQSSEPELFRVNLEAKYLCNQASARAAEDDGRLEAFRGIPSGQKERLAARSNRLYRNDPRRWREWMAYPVEKQMEAGGGTGGFR